MTRTRRKALQSFITSRDKLESVNRIAALTGSGPEDLGPGSKERKRVLENLARHIGLDVRVRRTKVQLGAAIAKELGVPWGPNCWSTGQTITRKGLDRLLEAAQRVTPSVRPRRNRLSRRDEAVAIVNRVSRNVPRVLRMKECILEMHNSGNPHWAQSEWAGFYFESLARAECEGALGGGPPDPIGRVRFDYELNRVWDFKTHAVLSARGRVNSWVLLNDSNAMVSVVKSRGLGLVIAEGDADFDDGPLRRWHHELKRRAGKNVRRATSGNRRVLKRRFKIRRIMAIIIPNEATLREGQRDGWIRGFAQGRQQSGRARNPKLKIKIDNVPSRIVYAERRFRSRE